MSVKSSVSHAHLHDLVREHGHKPVLPRHHVLLTGASRAGSIGQAIRQHLQHLGHGVVTLDHDVRHDVSFECGPADTLVCCHGVTHLDWCEDAPMEKVQEIFDVNVVGTYRVVQHFVRTTKDRHYRKRIVLIGSMAHRAVLNGSSAYCASKAAVAMLGRCLAWELAPKAYDVFVIHPSNTEGTPMTDETIAGLQRYRGLSREDAIAYWQDSPIRSRILQPQEIAELVAFVLTSAASYLSGSQLELGGGQR